MSDGGQSGHASDQITNECVWDELKLEYFLPNNWTHPTIPQHMVEIHDTGEGQVMKELDKKTKKMKQILPL